MIGDLFTKTLILYALNIKFLSPYKYLHSHHCDNFDNLHHNKQHLCDVLGYLLLIAVTTKKADVIFHVLQLSCCCLHSFSVSYLTTITGRIRIRIRSWDSDRLDLNFRPLSRA